MDDESGTCRHVELTNQRDLESRGQERREGKRIGDSKASAQRGSRRANRRPDAAAKSWYCECSEITADATPPADWATGRRTSGQTGKQGSSK